MARVIASGTLISPGFSRPSVSWCTFRLRATGNIISVESIWPQTNCYWKKLFHLVKTLPSFSMPFMSARAVRQPNGHNCCIFVQITLVLFRKPRTKRWHFSMQTRVLNAKTVPVSACPYSQNSTTALVMLDVFAKL